jgi:DNA-binding CsgD family transcriptional regulator
LPGREDGCIFQHLPRAALLSERDVDGLLSVLGLAASLDGAKPFELPVVERLVELIPAAGAGYWEYENGRSRGRGRDAFFVQYCDGDCGTSERWDDLLPWWPLRDDRLTSLGTATFFSDAVSEREKKSHPWYADVMRPTGQEHECKVLLPAPAGVIRGFYFFRRSGTRDFDERDRAVLNALRPHLEGVRRRWERHRVSAAGLTLRERELVVLLREGLTNQEIAERLVISTGTVRTDLENIFDKLGVHTRTAAVARAFGNTRQDAVG